MALNNPLEDADRVPPAQVSDTLIASLRDDAIRYLKKKNALDLIPDLGLGDNEYARKQVTAH